MKKIASLPSSVIQGPGPTGLSQNYRRIYSLISDMAAFLNVPILRFEERFPYSSKTNRAMNFALDFNVCVWVKYSQSTWFVEQAYPKAILLSFVLFFLFHSSTDIVGLQVVARYTLFLPLSRCNISYKYKKNVSFSGSVPVAIFVINRWGFLSFVSLVGGMATLTNASDSCENFQFLSRF